MAGLALSWHQHQPLPGVGRMTNGTDASGTTGYPNDNRAIGNGIG
jgi:hypothetical protein